jgi:hypothetical protein
MKKSIILLSGAGIAAGVAIALTNTKKKKKNERLTNSEEGERAGDEHGNADLTAQDEGSTESSAVEAKPPSTNNGDQTAASMKKLGAETESASAAGEIAIDDHGTDQETASAILERVRDDAFDSSDEKLALALGRPTEEVTGWMNGSEIIDGDVLLKARALAIERGVEVPDAAASN